MSKAVAEAPPRESLFDVPRSTGWLVNFGRAGGLFWRDNAPGMAGTIAFFGFLSVIPLVLLFLALAGGVLNGRVSDTEIRHLFHSVTPGLSQQQFLQTYWHPIEHSRVANTILGVVSLLLGTLGLHDSVDWAVNRLWQSSSSRSAALGGIEDRFWLVSARGQFVQPRVRTARFKRDRHAVALDLRHDLPLWRGALGRDPGASCNSDGSVRGVVVMTDGLRPLIV